MNKIMIETKRENMKQNIKSIVIFTLTLLLVTGCQPKENHTVAVDPVNNEVTDDVKTKEPKVVLKGCTKEAKQCPNGRVVGRNPKNNCEFDPCEKKSPKSNKDSVMCPADVKECPDGSFVSRDHKNNCKFKECPNSEQ